MSKDLLGTEILNRIKNVVFSGIFKDQLDQFEDVIKLNNDQNKVAWKFISWLLTNKDINPNTNHPTLNGIAEKCADVITSLLEGHSVEVTSIDVLEAAAVVSSDMRVASTRRDRKRALAIVTACRIMHCIETDLVEGAINCSEHLINDWNWRARKAMGYKLIELAA